MSNKELKFPSLDGLRALSIIIVIAQHFSSSHQFGPHDYLWRFQLCDMGVRIFFVISGFLITSLLLSENEENGCIDLPNFYARRFLRIFPAYYSFLFIVGIFTLANLISVTASDFLGPISYLSNYIGTTQLLGHTWSLAVEQQFYLIWPIILVILGFRTGLILAAIFIIAAPIARVLLSIDTETPATLWTHFELTGDALSAGCIFAILRQRMWEIPLYRKFISKPILIASVPIVIFLTTSHQWPIFWNGLGTLAANILIVLILDNCMRLESSVIYKILNRNPLKFIGLISYSLYIWQQFFAYSKLTNTYGISLILMFAVAISSYFIIEKPALRLKRFFQSQ